AADFLEIPSLLLLTTEEVIDLVTRLLDKASVLSGNHHFRECSFLSLNSHSRVGHQVGNWFALFNQRTTNLLIRHFYVYFLGDFSIFSI
ncbi:hypothetical protein HN51_031156, partial [Arachis hypogaea]